MRLPGDTVVLRPDDGQPGVNWDGLQPRDVYTYLPEAWLEQISAARAAPDPADIDAVVRFLSDV